MRIMLGEKFIALLNASDSFTYSIESWTEADWNYESEKMETRVETYPQPVVLPRTIGDEEILPEKIRLIYNEIINAIHAELPFRNRAKSTHRIHM